MGQSAISMGAQALFDHQLDAQYVLTDWDSQWHLVRAIESTVIKGNVLVLTNDGQLVAACYSIKKYTEKISDLGKTLNLEVPELVGPEWAEGLDPDPEHGTAFKGPEDSHGRIGLCEQPPGLRQRGATKVPR